MQRARRGSRAAREELPAAGEDSKFAGEEPPSAGEEPPSAGGVADEVQQRGVVGDERGAASMLLGRGKLESFRGLATLKLLRTPFTTGFALQPVLKTL